MCMVGQKITCVRYRRGVFMKFVKCVCMCCRMRDTVFYASYVLTNHHIQSPQKHAQIIIFVWLLKPDR